MERIVGTRTGNVFETAALLYFAERNFTLIIHCSNREKLIKKQSLEINERNSCLVSVAFVEYLNIYDNLNRFIVYHDTPSPSLAFHRTRTRVLD